MAFRWEIKAVAAQDAMDNGTGIWEPFAYDQEDGNIFVKRFTEVIEDLPTPDDGEEAESKRSEVSGGLGKDW